MDACIVLILVLMEDTLGEQPCSYQQDCLRGLNPCFNGRYSRSPDDCDLRQYFAQS